MKKILSLALMAFFSLSALAGDDVKMPTLIENDGFRGVLADAGAAYIAGQPTEKALKAMADEGVKMVINLRTPGEMADRSKVPYDEAMVVRDLGMDYVHIPLGGDENPYRVEAIEKLIKSINAAGGKVLLHCASGRRASHAWGAYLIEGRGLTVGEATEHARAVGRGEPIFDGLIAKK